MAEDKGLDYVYDAQIRRYLLQFIRIFTSLQYQTGRDRNGEQQLRQVPAHYAHKDRMVAHILRNNSENVILSTPFVTAAIQDLSMDANRRQVPNLTRKMQVTEREIDPTAGEYTGEQGNRYTVERFMPVPYNLTMQVDIWTSNEQQKHQLLEQILVLFNPSIDLQSSTNPIDWTALTHVQMNNITWSSRSLPIGTDDEIDVATLTFEMPIWINPPAKIQRQNIIQVIRTNISDVMPENCPTGSGISPTGEADEGTLGQVVTRGYDIFVQQVNSDFEITLLNKFSLDTDPDGNTYEWETEIFQPDKYGKLIENQTQIRLITTKDIDATEKDIVGTVQKHPNETNKLIWNIDPLTLPTNTLDSISGIVDPHDAYPGNGLDPSANGQRYLLLDEIGDTQAWGDIDASANDIIQYDGNSWNVVFDASENDNIEYLVNSFNGRQLKFNGEEWVFAVDGVYHEGEFRIYNSLGL